MTDHKTGFINPRASRQRAAAAVLFCAPLVAVPLGAHAQETSNASEEGSYRLAPIIVNTQAQAAVDDDSDSVVAQELWVGGKVATSILNTPASVSVVTQKEIEQRSASTTEEVFAIHPWCHHRLLRH